MTRLILAVVLLAVAGCGGSRPDEPWHVNGAAVECPGATVQTVPSGTLCDWTCVDYQGQRVRLSVLFDGATVKASAVESCSP